MNYSGDQTVFNIGSSQGASLIQIIGYIENILNKKVEILYLKREESRMYQRMSWTSVLPGGS